MNNVIFAIILVIFGMIVEKVLRLLYQLWRNPHKKSLKWQILDILLKTRTDNYPPQTSHFTDYTKKTTEAAQDKGQYFVIAPEPIAVNALWWQIIGIPKPCSTLSQIQFDKMVKDWWRYNSMPPVTYTNYPILYKAHCLNNWSKNSQVIIRMIHTLQI